MIFNSACDIVSNSVKYLFNTVKYFEKEAAIIKKDEILEEILKTFAMAARANALNFLQINLKGENALLLQLIATDGKSTPGALAETLGVSPARIAAMLRSLEFKKLVERVCDEKDKRRVTVTITAHGRQFVESISEAVNCKARKLLEKLGEQDAREFLRILKKCTGFDEKIKDAEENTDDNKTEASGINKNDETNEESDMVDDRIRGDYSENGF